MEKEVSYIKLLSYLDVLHDIVWDDFEIRLPALYPDWPKGTDKGDEKIVAALNATYQNNKEKFKHVKKLYFYIVDHFDFGKIIDQPA